MREDVGIIRFSEPTYLNALSAASVEELSASFEKLALQSRAIVLTAEGPAFCAGAKLESDLDEDLGLILETHVNPLMTQLRELPVPWVAAVRGAAAGAGCSIALAADLIVASEDAYFLQAFVRIGLVPDAGSTYMLSRIGSRVRAMEMMLLGERLPAARALDWGLINKVVSADTLDDTALELAQRLARGPTRTLGAIRELAWAAADSDWQTTLQRERVAQNRIGRTADAREGIGAFLQKRKPRFTAS
jgi:2-(1,2-epoxy-1,2-dihydrophenyl)acetyl-CoA isomerase